MGKNLQQRWPMYIFAASISSSVLQVLKEPFAIKTINCKADTHTHTHTHSLSHTHIHTHTHIVPIREKGGWDSFENRTVLDKLFSKKENVVF